MARRGLSCRPVPPRACWARRCTSAQGQKLKLEVIFDLKENSLVAAKSGGNPNTVAIPEITKVEYERTARRRWTAGVVVSGLFLLSKGSSRRT